MSRKPKIIALLGVSAALIWPVASLALTCPTGYTQKIVSGKYYCVKTSTGSVDGEFVFNPLDPSSNGSGGFFPSSLTFNVTPLPFIDDEECGECAALASTTSTASTSSSTSQVPNGLVLCENPAAPKSKGLAIAKIPAEEDSVIYGINFETEEDTLGFTLQLDGTYIASPHAFVNNLSSLNPYCPNADFVAVDFIPTRLEVFGVILPVVDSQPNTYFLQCVLDNPNKVLYDGGAKKFKAAAYNCGPDDLPPP